MKVWEQWKAEAEKEAEKAKAMTERAVKAEEALKPLQAEVRKLNGYLLEQEENMRKRDNLLIDIETLINMKRSGF
jgi:hypothetical protein